MWNRSEQVQCTPCSAATTTCCLVPCRFLYTHPSHSFYTTHPQSHSFTVCWAACALCLSRRHSGSLHQQLRQPVATSELAGFIYWWGLVVVVMLLGSGDWRGYSSRVVVYSLPTTHCFLLLPFPAKNNTPSKSNTQATAYAFNDEFSRVLQQRSTYFSNDPSADVINRVRGEITQVRYL